jgi:hypothetical protein
MHVAEELDPHPGEARPYEGGYAAKDEHGVLHNAKVERRTAPIPLAVHIRRVRSNVS